MRIRPGVYREAITVVQSMELVGDGPREEIVIESAASDALRWAADAGRVSGLTIRHVGPQSQTGWAAAYVEGAPTFENCALTSSDGAVVQVLGPSSKPTFKGNRIHGGAQAGVALREQARGIYEGNEISGNALAGVEILDRGRPVFRQNRIADNKLHGVIVSLGGGGDFEENEILDNGQDGIAVEKNGSIVARGNTVSGNGFSAVWIGPKGGGAFADNDLRGNVKGAWSIDDGAGKIERSGNQE